MKHIMQGRNLIVLESESASELLYMIEFLLKRCSSNLGGRKKTLQSLMSEHGKGFTVWQELKDNTKEIMGHD